MKNRKRRAGKFSRIVIGSITVALCGLFLYTFFGPLIIRGYVELCLGNCQKIPFLCKTPLDATIAAHPDQSFKNELIAKTFPTMSIHVPPGFSITQELIKKPSYKKSRSKFKDAIIYALYEPPGFFVDMYPRVAKQGITDNYTFIKRTLYAKLRDIKSIDDAFFVIMKSIITPDVGDQNAVIMAPFTLGEKKGFINYTLGKNANYFDCCLFNDADDYFKIYIKDIGARLTVGQVFTIIDSAQSLQ